MRMTLTNSSFFGILVLALVFGSGCHGFAAGGGPDKFPNFNELLKDISKANPFAPSDEPKPKDGKAGKALLKELNIRSSTKPRTFYARPQEWPALLTASVPAVCRLGSGVFADGYQISIVDKDESQYTLATLGNQYQVKESSQQKRRQQQEPIIIYEFDACPFCRKVREAVSILSLIVTYRPCPANGQRYRREIKTNYGETSTFPFLRDPNTGVEMFESDSIVEYLFKTYGNGNIPWTLSKRSSGVVTATAGVGLLARLGSGGSSKPSNPPDQPVMLWAYEGSPFCKLVREELCALEIPHTQVSCPRGSANRQILMEQTGRFQVPFLQDPNTGVSLFENQAIIEYIQKQYGISPSPVKYL